MYDLLIFSTSLNMIEIDRNMSELRQIVSINIILTLAHFLVLWHELCINART